MRAKYLHCSATRLTLAVFSKRPFAHSWTLTHYAIQDFKASSHPNAKTAATIEEWTDAVYETLQILLKDPSNRDQLSSKGPFTVILSGGFLFSQRLNIPQVRPQYQEAITSYEASQCLPYPPEQITLAFQTLNKDDVETDAFIAAVPKLLVDRLCCHLKSLNLNPTSLRSGPTLHLNTLCSIYPQNDTGLNLLLDIGTRSTQILLVKNARDFHLRSLSIGGDTLTQTIAEALKISFKAAERLKFDSTKPFKTTPTCPTSKTESPTCVSTVFQSSIDSFLQRIDQEITRTLLLRKDAEPLVRILVTGGGSLIPGLIEKLKKTRTAAVEQLDPVRHLTLGNKVLHLNKAALREPATASTLSEIVGESVVSSIPHPLQLEMLPQAFVNEVTAARRRPLVLAAAACWSVAAFFLLLHFRSNLYQLKDETQKLETQLSQTGSGLQALHDSLNTAEQTAHDLVDEITYLKRLSHSRNYWVTFLDDLQSRLHQVEDVWLDTLVPTSSALSERTCPLRASGHLLLRDFDPENPGILISQNAIKRIESLINHLQASPFIADVESLRFDTRNNRLLTFHFTLLPNDNPPL